MNNAENICKVITEGVELLWIDNLLLDIPPWPWCLYHSSHVPEIGIQSEYSKEIIVNTRDKTTARFIADSPIIIVSLLSLVRKLQLQIKELEQKQ